MFPSACASPSGLAVCRHFFFTANLYHIDPLFPTTMPIAIYRLMKLTVATLKHVNQPIRPFSNRRAKELSLYENADGNGCVTFMGTEVSLQRSRVTNRDEIWRFCNGKVEVENRTRRNGGITASKVQDIAPMWPMVWTHQEAAWIADQFERGTSSRCIVEQYLHQHIPNPYDYRVTTFDFNPMTMPFGHPPSAVYEVRDPEAVVSAALTDKSDSAAAWVNLLLGD